MITNVSLSIRTIVCSLLAPRSRVEYKRNVRMTTRNIERNLEHLFDGSDWNVYCPKVLNLGVGAPGPDLLENCCDIFQKATEHRLKYEREKNLSLLFQYGPTSGIYEARSAIANYFTDKFEHGMKGEDLLVTSGATQGLHIILSTLVDMTGFVFVDEVTYMIALDTIRQFTTLRIVPVRLNDDGVDLEEMEHLLKDLRFQSQTKLFWGMYYTIPTYHNPTGICFSDEICTGLIKLARKYDVLIACDDVYNILHYVDEKPRQRLFSFDNPNDVDFRGNVISNGSFSKTISPGIRLGWLEAPARMKSILDGSGLLNSGGGLNNYTSGLLASLFELGLAQNHIATLHAAYKERMLAMCEVLEKKLPSTCRMRKPRGGYFIWIELPAGVNVKEFQKICMEREKIFFIPGERFTLPSDKKNQVGHNCLRISIAFQTVEKLVDGGKRFCDVLRNYLEKSQLGGKL